MLHLKKGTLRAIFLTKNCHCYNDNFARRTKKVYRLFGFKSFMLRPSVFQTKL
jgi:hypothetical protein